MPTRVRRGIVVVLSISYDGVGSFRATRFRISMERGIIKFYHTVISLTTECGPTLRTS